MVIIIVSMIAIIVILFVGMVMFLQKFFNREVTSATSHLDSLISETSAKEEEVKKQYEEAKRQSQEIISNAQKDAAIQKENILKAVAEEKAKIIDEAHAKADEVIKQADNARLALLDELQQKISERAIVKAQELLQEVLPEDFRKEVHARWVSDIIANSFTQLDRLRVPQGLGEVKVVCAFSLNDQEKSSLKLKLKEKLGFEVKLLEETDPSLICGLVVNIGSLILDGSLKFKIQGAARD
jgi:F0F1-type ATP synthase membrane subunit b/b'